MRQLKHFRWAAALMVVIALAPAAAPAEEDDTLTISGTFNMDWSYGPVGADLAEVYANGHNHTWTLTLRGTTHSHSTSDYLGVNRRNTQIHAASFDFEFFGPDAATLNGIVSEYIAEWDVMIELSNYYSPGGNAAFIWVQLKNVSWDLVFYVGHDFLNGSDGSETLFPSDADGYPVVGPDPFSIWSDFSYIQDWRPWNEGWIYSQPSLVTFEESVSEPDFNFDRSVDAADYVMWRKSPNSVGGAGGYSTWRSNFGQTTSGGLAASENPVPEPGSLALLTLAVPALLRRRQAPAAGPVRLLT